MTNAPFRPIFPVMNAARASRAVRSGLAGVCALIAVAFATPAARAQGSRALGSACQVASDCTSRYCVSGMCCDSACTASCQSCFSALTGSTNGFCQPVKSGQADPQGLCGTPICSGTTLTGGVCNVNGGCQTGSVSCAPFACNGQGTGCNMMCSSASECAPGASCEGVTCVLPEGGVGAPTSFDGPSVWKCAIGGRSGGGCGLAFAAALVACLACRRRESRRAGR